MHDDLWLISTDGKKVWQLINEPNTKQEGILLPVFSADGRLVAWSQRQPDRKYIIKVADFVETPQPHLENIRSYQPGGQAYYEPGSFSSDGRSLFYTSDQDTHSFWASQIYRLDLDTGHSMRLTSGNLYNEHPVVMATPTGDEVVYMSDRDEDHHFMHMPGTDWWAMRSDGSELKRLTWMNVNRPDNPEYAGALRVACRATLSPDGTYMLGDVQDNLIRQTGMILKVHFQRNK
jgi:Tol biopolymer transport system component